MQQEKLGKDFKSVLQKFQTASQVAISKERETVGKSRNPGTCHFTLFPPLASTNADTTVPDRVVYITLLDFPC